MSIQEIKLKAIADAIRYVEGSTAPIPAPEFPEKIRALSLAGAEFSIAITTPPSKTNYYVGDTFDPAGMVVQGTFESGLVFNIPVNYLTISPSGALSEDVTQITVTFEGVSTNQPISVAEYVATIPSQAGSLTYTGAAQTPTWNNYDSDNSTVQVTPETDAGNYTATFTLLRGAWEDGTRSAKTIPWIIGRASVAVPMQGGTLTYTGDAQSPSWSGYDNNKLTLGGTASATNAGNYNATFTPKSNYQWTDGTISEKTVLWTIDKASLAVPSQSGSLTYTGAAQSPTWSNYDSGKITIGGATSATDAGSYLAAFAPKSNYQWEDGTTAAKSISWSIAKAAGSLSINKTSMTLNASTLTGTITVTRAGDGAITATSSNTSVATVSVSGTTITVTAKNSGSATITINVGEGANYTAPASKTCSVTVELAHVFGVKWDSNNSSTSLTRLTPANDPQNYVTTEIATEPVAAVGTGAGSSPFDNYAPWKDMEEYNIINGAVSYKRGASGFSRTAYDTMVYIPEFWHKTAIDESGNWYYYISNSAKSGFVKHPGSGRYVGRYNTISGYYSKSGAAPLVSITRATARTGSKAKGSKWHLYDFASWCAVGQLYLTEYADWDSQSKIGRGYVDGNSAAINSGATDSMIYHTGRAAGTDGQTAVQYRHIENPWGNVYQWVDGINFSNRSVYICLDPSKYADDTTDNYMSAGVTLPSGNGYIKSLGYSSSFPWAFLPNDIGGSETTYIPDRVYSDANWRVLCVGGDWIGGSRAGLFCFNASNTSSSTSAGIGARLLYIP